MGSILGAKKPIVGMVHLPALPGSPGFTGDVAGIYEAALRDALRLAEGGVDALLIENFFDTPYVTTSVSLEQVATMAAAAREIRLATAVPIGINVQFNDYEAELAIAVATGAQFIRVEVFVDTVVTAQGILHPVSAQLARLRRRLGAEGVQLIADIQPKYTRNIVPTKWTASAQDAAAAGADAIVVTGAGTGQEAPIDVVKDVKGAVDIPVFIGSGMTADNAALMMQWADGAIVGSAFKRGGDVGAPVDVRRVRTLIQAARSVRPAG